MLIDHRLNYSEVALHKSILFYLGLGFLMLISPVALYLDLVLLDNTISEFSVTELTQEVLLLISCAIFGYLAYRFRESRHFLTLVAAFYAVMLVREMDYYFDFIMHGFWKYPAVSIALPAIVYALKHRKATARGMQHFMGCAGGVFSISGLLALMFFSRVFGSSKLWQPVMGDDFPYEFKAALQEGTELFCYSVIFSGALFTLLLFRHFHDTYERNSNSLRG